MKHASLLAAAAIVLVANAFGLIHALRNRSGPVENDITLTERELALDYHSDAEDSGVALDFRWMDPLWASSNEEHPMVWLDRKILQELGFDTTVAPSAYEASEFYGLQRARRAFVALEYDGPAWRQYLDQVKRRDRQSAEREKREHPELSHRDVPEDAHQSDSRLIAIDASADAARLRARHPDRNSVIVVPAVVRITVVQPGSGAVVEPYSGANPGRPPRPALLSGYIHDIPSSIHVPLPLSDALRRAQKERSGPKYRVHLRYGASFEPWIVGVEFLRPASQ